MERDYELFPDDDNGDVLWHFRTRGDALSEPREIDFSVILPSEQAALDFSLFSLRSGFKVELAKADQCQEDGLDWEVIVYTTVVPTHADITMLENELERQAAALGGRTSGWSAVFIGSS